MALIRGRRKIYALAATLLLAFCGSCALFSTKLPPGFTRSSGLPVPAYPQGTPDAAIYALLTWYLETEAGKDLSPSYREAVSGVRIHAGKRVFAAWAQELLQKGAPLVRLDGGIPQLVPLAFSQNLKLEQGASILETLRNECPEEFTIPASAAENLATTGHLFTSSERTSYRAWATTRQTLTIPDPDAFHRAEFRAQLNTIGQVVEIKRILLQTLQQAKETNLEDPAAFQQLLDDLTAVKNNLPEKLSLAAIGDDTTLPQFLQLCESLPQDNVASAIGRAESTLLAEKQRLVAAQTRIDAGTAAILDGLESTLSQNLVRWRGDARFTTALAKSEERFQRLVSDLAALRLEQWKASLEAHRAAARHWDGYLFFRTALANLRQETSSMRLYRLMSVPGQDSWTEKMSQELVAQYFSHLPSALEEYLETARKEMEIDIKGHPGLAVAICTMVLRMCEIPVAAPLPQDVQNARSKAEELLAKARTQLEKNQLVRPISIGNFSSDTPGIGTTYAKDLQHELATLLQAFGLNRFSPLPEEDSKPSRWDYSTFGGRVANYDGQETTERQTFRTVRRNGPGRRLPNPEYDKNASRTAQRRVTSPFLYEQEVLLQAIHVKEFERIAHIRVFMNFNGPGFTSLVEVNEFYSKMFFYEESHPINDVKTVATLRYYDAMDVPKEDPEPALKYDRIWTPGELLDWARQDSLRVAALLLLYHISDYPLHLQKRVQELLAKANYPDATELLGQCYVLCQALDFDSDLTPLLKTKTPPAAKAYEPTIQKLRAQRKKLSALKHTIEQDMLHATNLTLQKK
ncbi:MAG: hypothetical protein IJJ26_05330 [Victivallales bacterium]|nr:hypothetical protein [Victivallales bacterium]